MTASNTEPPLRETSTSKKPSTKCLEKIDGDHLCPRANVMCSNCKDDVQSANENTDFRHTIACPCEDQRAEKEKTRHRVVQSNRHVSLEISQVKLEEKIQKMKKVKLTKEEKL